MDVTGIVNASDQAITNAAGQITGIAETLWKNPETGCRENAAAALLTGELEKPGFTVKKDPVIPGEYDADRGIHQDN